MNRSPFDRQRFSVNSSLATLKNHEATRGEATANKRIQSKRFSYQVPQQYQNTLQKQNFGNNANKCHYLSCLNHPHEKALFSVLENTNDPMFLCERCAIMVASKGFEVSKIQEKQTPQLTFDFPHFKNQISSTFKSIKMNKNQTFVKLAENQNKIEKKEDEIQKYFIKLHEFLDCQKEESLREIRRCRQELQAMKHQATNYYLMLLEKVKDISEKKTKMPLEISSQFQHYLQELSKSSFKISTAKITCDLQLKSLSRIQEEINAFIYQTESKEVKTRGEFKVQCEKQNSSIRSLQLSFEEDPDSRPTQMLKNGVQSLSSNLLSSIDLFCND